MTVSTKKTVDTLAEARRRRAKPDVDTEYLVERILLRTRCSDEDVTDDEWGGAYGVRQIESHDAVLQTGNKLPELALPGFGRRLEDCGKPLPHFCEEGHSREIDRTCNRSVCPRGASSWCRRRAVAKCSQLLGLLKIQLKRKPYLQIFFHHVVISPPADWEAKSERDAMEEGFDVVREIMEEMEMEGVVAYHPYRGEEEGPDGQGDDMGEWKERLFSGRDWKDVRGELEFSPHFHVITATSWVPGNTITEQIQAETGWVVHRIADEDSGRSVDGDDAMVKAVTYCISHAGIYEDSNGDNQAAVREIGRTINQDVKVSRNKEWAEKKTKKIAWQTLGIPSADLRCEESVEEKGGMVLSNSNTGGGGGSASSASGGGAAGDLDADAPGCGHEHADGDEFDDLEANGAGASRTPTQCGGDLTKLHGAPQRLADEEWVRSASAADELLETYLLWRDEEPLVKEIEEREGLTLEEDYLQELLPDEGGG